MDNALLPFTKAVKDAKKRLSANPKSMLAKEDLVSAKSALVLRAALVRAYSGIRLS
jgi:hypothetical protein